MLVRERLAAALSAAISRAHQEGALPGESMPAIQVDVPPSAELGDFSSDVARSLARSSRQTPAQVAETLASRLEVGSSAADGDAAAWVERDIKSILFIQFLLQFFYAWMIIYTPLYLHTVAGFDWPTIGVIFTAMLAPFVLLEGPLGWVADKVGEKTILSVGFVIMGASTGLIGYVTDHNIYIWAAILFMTRVGAAMVEVMADTYFFKKVDATNSNVISFSRMARPTAYVVGPVVATLLFTVFDMKGLFIFLGLFMLYGLRYSLTMREAR